MVDYVVGQLGQVFTPDTIVERMLKLRKNRGRVLEPSCGAGAFSNKIEDCVAIEKDAAVCPTTALNMDFFDYPLSEEFDTIIGNPPYVRYKDILNETKLKLDMSLFDERCNLYFFFIHKAIQHLREHGELIFIVPREFLKATAAIRLNTYIFENGTITDIVDLGDKPIFKNFAPNCVIFRYEKGNFDRTTSDGKLCILEKGQLLFLSNEYTVNFSDLFFVKVGAASGGNKYFEHENGNKEFVYSKTRQTGKLLRMFYNIETPELLPYKDKLQNRHIRKFTEKTWYMWGRNLYESDMERLYVNCKTRQKNPFFYNECKNYDAAVLGIFPKFQCSIEDLHKICKELNAVNWKDLGFLCGDRYLFTQKALENTLLPTEFLKWKDKLV